MTLKFYDRVWVTVASAPGTGVVALSSPITAFQSFAQAGASNGDTFPYLIVDGSSWEFGIGTYNSTGPTISRTTRTQSSTGSAISFTSNAVVTCTLRGEDVKPTLASLNDVTISSPTTGQVLTWSGTAWANATPSGGGSSTLASDTDVSLSSPSSGQALTYNGTAWVNVNGSLGRFRGEYVPFAPPQASWFDLSGAHDTLTATNYADQGLYISTPAGSTSSSWEFVRRSTSAWGTTWSATVRIRLGNLANRAYVNCGIGVQDSAGKLCMLSWGASGSGFSNPAGLTLDTYSNNNTYNSALLSNVHVTNTPPELMRVAYDGTNLKFGVSWDGLTWETVSVAATSYLSDHAYIAIGGQNYMTTDGAIGFVASNFGMLITYYDDPDHPATAHYGS
jgi:hypothetical protein